MAHVLHYDEAFTKASGLVGTRTPNRETGWCLQWVIQKVYNDMGPYYWIGGNPRVPWAITFWEGAARRGKVIRTTDSTVIPKGAPTVTKGRSPYGHIFVKGEGDSGIGTDYPRSTYIGEFEIPNLLRSWNHKLVGFIEISGTKVDYRNLGYDEMDPANYYLGAQGEHITWLGQRLLAHGYPYKYKVTDTFTKSDLKAIQWFQQQQGWTGWAADGYPGEMTLELLKATPK